MSDYSPPPRAGYTKTGKSIRAVKRYYAQKNASRKKKSPDDEKLSKRIAAELKVQQEANKKRNRQSGTFENEPTERSALPIIMQTREVGPTFVTSPKSVKSAKSAGTVAQNVENPTLFDNIFDTASDGCLVACFLLGAIYIGAWIHYHLSSKDWKEKSIQGSSMNSIRWIGITSICIVSIVPIWFWLRERFGPALLSLISMIACAASFLVHLVYYIVVEKLPEKSTNATSPTDATTDKPQQPKYYLSSRNPLNFWLSITFLLMTLISISIMIKQQLNLVSKQMDANKRKGENSGDGDRDGENGHGPALSQYMAPA